MCEQRIHIKTTLVIDAACHITYSNHTGSFRREEARGVAADGSEALHGRGCNRQVRTDTFACFLDNVDKPATGGFRTSERTSKHDRFSGYYRGNGVADLLAVRVHQPCH